MRNIFLISIVAVLCFLAPQVSAAPWRKSSLDRLNQRIHGKLIDYSHNHGEDRRIWSEALCQWRDLYVYVPPCYDPCQHYPLVLYLHGYSQDETTFLESVVEWFDEVIANGKLCPVIIAFPDGSIKGRTTFYNSASFYVNSLAGRFEDFIMEDLWQFLFSHYPLRTEREAHVIVGISMGGTGAFRLAFIHPDRFRVIIGFMPAVNLRWLDCHEHYHAKFDPECWEWHTKLNGLEPVGRFYGIITVRFWVLIKPVFGLGPDALEKLSKINPIELLDACDVREGMFDMFIGYAGKDEFNIDTQVNSFLFKAKERCLTVQTSFDPNGKHSLESGRKLFPDSIEFLAPLLAPYGPPCHAPVVPGK